MSDPVHDDEAYAVLRAEAYAMEQALRRIEHERDVERLQRRLAAEAEAERVHREELNAKYPSTISAEIYEIATRLAHNQMDDYADPKEIAEEYEYLVGVINKAVGSVRAECARETLSRTQSRYNS